MNTHTKPLQWATQSMNVNIFVSVVSELFLKLIYHGAGTVCSTYPATKVLHGPSGTRLNCWADPVVYLLLLKSSLVYFACKGQNFGHNFLRHWAIRFTSWDIVKKLPKICWTKFRELKFRRKVSIEFLSVALAVFSSHVANLINIYARKLQL